MDVTLNSSDKNKSATNGTYFSPGAAISGENRVDMKQDHLVYARKTHDPNSWDPFKTDIFA